MNATYTFSECEVEQLKLAMNAIRSIDCRVVNCPHCPLYADGCIANRLYSIIRAEERKKEVQS